MKKNYIFAKSNLVNTKLVCEKRVGWGASPSGFFIWIISDIRKPQTYYDTFSNHGE